MKRDSFVFYRSFYKAIQCVGDATMRLQLYDALAAYALDGEERDDVGENVGAMLCLMRPIIDTNNKRYENGHKGAKYGAMGGRPRLDTSRPIPAEKAQDLKAFVRTFDQEVEKMKKDEIWLREGVCMAFHYTLPQVHALLDIFLAQCKAERPNRPHTDDDDARRHFCSWLRRRASAGLQLPDNDKPDYSAGFDSSDK